MLSALDEGEASTFSGRQLENTAGGGRSAKDFGAQLKREHSLSRESDSDSDVEGDKCMPGKSVRFARKSCAGDSQVSEEAGVSNSRENSGVRKRSCEVSKDSSIGMGKKKRHRMVIEDSDSDEETKGYEGYSIRGNKRRKIPKADDRVEELDISKVACKKAEKKYKCGDNTDDCVGGDTGVNAVARKKLVNPSGNDNDDVKGDDVTMSSRCGYQTKDCSDDAVDCKEAYAGMKRILRIADGNHSDDEVESDSDVSTEVLDEHKYPRKGEHGHELSDHRYGKTSARKKCRINREGHHEHQVDHRKIFKTKVNNKCRNLDVYDSDDNAKTKRTNTGEKKGYEGSCEIDSDYEVERPNLLPRKRRAG